MIYLDNAATTQIDPEVLETMLPYLKDNYGNAGSIHSAGRTAAEAIAKARKQVADLISAQPEQIIFTSGGSESNSLVFQGMECTLVCMGRTKVITTTIEHDSILKAAFRLHGWEGYDVEYIRPNYYGIINPDTVKGFIDDNTGLVSVMHTNNETGAVNDVSTIGKICHEHNVLFHTDCVQALGFHDLNVDKLNCDFMSMSSHKIHGPKGVGALYVKNKDNLQAIIQGGSNQEFGLRGGTENVAGIVGFGKACEIATENLQQDREKILNLKQRLVDELLNKCRSTKIIINGSSRESKVLNLTFKGIDGETLLLMLDSRGVCISAGSACTSHENKPSHVLTAMGINDEDARNSIRISLSKMTTEEEIDEAVEIILNCVDILSKGEI